jgi:outer membrane protein assembly factor BamB
MQADDWPQWLGPNRDGIWQESGIVESFPTNGLTVIWRTSINAGYCGPAVANNRVYLMDRKAGPPLQRKPGDRSLPELAGNERVLCLDAGNGQQVWEHVYDCAYRIDYPAGPRATPVVSEGRVYTLGAMGDLLCLDASTGKLIWEKHLLKDFELPEPPLWGYAAHPLIDGDRLICLVGGSNSVVVAFNKETGSEIWRALSAPEIGYAAPVLMQSQGQKQLIVWHPDAISGLEPETGAVLWSQKYPVHEKPQRPEVTIAMPRVKGNEVLVTSFYHGALLLRATNDPPGVSVVWNRHTSRKSSLNDGLHTTMSVPAWIGNHIYGFCGFGEFRCLNAATGDRVWESEVPMQGKLGNFATAFTIQHEDRVFIWNDQGELVLGKVSPEGFELVSRAKLLEPMENTRGRNLLWCHPAFANRRMYVHNSKELICVDLAKR